MSNQSQLPMVSLSVAEKVLRDIARREGEAIKKRRSRTMISNYGPGYMIYDPRRNTVLSGTIGAAGQDGCGDSIIDVASRYEDSEGNTPWQKIVIASIKAGRVREATPKCRTAARQP